VGGGRSHQLIAVVSSIFHFNWRIKSRKLVVIKSAAIITVEAINQIFSDLGRRNI
jgi:hypothetical protein